MNNFLRRLIAEEVENRLLSAEDETNATRHVLDSVDDQIDSFLIKFEQDSIIPPDEEEMYSLDESLKRKSLVALLTEQEEVEAEEEVAAFDDPAAEVADEPAAEEGGEAEEETEPEEEVAGNEAMDSEDPGELPKPNLNIDEFSKRVARLAKNDAVLLRVKDVIINRAKNYLLENYGEKNADVYERVMEEEFGFHIDGKPEIPAAPFAVGANPAGAGSMGGGGG